MPGMVVSATNQEHGIVSVRGRAKANPDLFQIGSALRILPNHACATGAMHGRYHVTDGGLEVVDVWPRVNRQEFPGPRLQPL